MKTILVNRFSSPMGEMIIGASDSGICLLEFDDNKLLEHDIPNAKIINGINEHILHAIKELEEYFAGTRQHFDVKLDPVGSDFQKTVWKSLLDIPYGKTITYTEQSLLLQMPKAVRAVASSNGLNKIAIIIPCHRVIGANGKLTGYGGGLERKRWLINHEREHCNDPLKPFRLF